jgi:16S rRNA (guanine527-N7)-methyltransferase
MWHWASVAHAITEDVLLIVTRLLPSVAQKGTFLRKIMRIQRLVSRPSSRRCLQRLRLTPGIGTQSPAASPFKPALSEFSPSNLQSPSVTPARIAELLAPFLGEYEHLDVQALFASILTYIDILLRWNSRINLTAIRDPEEIVTRHFGESFFLARNLFVGTPAIGCPAGQSPAVAGPSTLADLGSGAGFPGIPIKLWAPSISLTLIESNHKKAAFLSEITRSLILMDVDIQSRRAETLPPATFDVVTLRAVERFDAALPIAARLLKPQGRLALLIGSAQVLRTRSLLPDHDFSDPLPIPLSTSRVLLMGERSSGVESG